MTHPLTQVVLTAPSIMVGRATPFALNASLTSALPATRFRSLPLAGLTITKKLFLRSVRRLICGLQRDAVLARFVVNRILSSTEFQTDHSRRPVVLSHVSQLRCIASRP